MATDIKGKTILITGAARRLGQRAALAAASHGANLILHYNSSADEVNATAGSVKELGVNVWTVQADLSDPDSIQRLMDESLAISPLFGLINNASIFKPVNFLDSSNTDWEQHLRVNLTAPFILTREFARNYSLTETGRVINLLDWRALRPGKDHFPYTISKAGLAALTKASALSLAPRIIVNAIALGAILPPEGEDENQDILKSNPMKRWAEIEEFEETILFLLEGPKYITGEIIHLDGGRHLV